MLVLLHLQVAFSSKTRIVKLSIRDIGHFSFVISVKHTCRQLQDSRHLASAWARGAWQRKPVVQVDALSSGLELGGPQNQCSRVQFEIGQICEVGIVKQLLLSSYWSPQMHGFR